MVTSSPTFQLLLDLARFRDWLTQGPVGRGIRTLGRPGISGPLCLVLLVPLAVAVNARAFDRGDLAVLLAIQPIVIPGMDPVAQAVTQLGEPGAIAALAIGLSIVRLQAKRPDFWVPLVVGLLLLAEVILKSVVVQPAPAEYGPSPTLGNSFPSGHVAREAFLVMAANSIPNSLVILAVAIAALVPIYWGHHWVTDVVGGLLLGVGSAWTAHAVKRTIAQASSRV